VPAAERPTLIEIMNDPWFTCGPVPPYVPASATAGTPHDMPLSRHREDWVRNFETIKRASGFRDDADDEAEEEEGGAVRRSAREERREQEKVEEERERLNKEVKKAVQPGSPISALLRTARQPLLKAAAQGGASGQRGAQPATASSTTSLARQLSALNIGRQQAAAAAHGGGKLPVSDSGRGADAFGDKENAGRREMAPPMAPRSRSNTLGTQQQADSAALGADERRVLGQKARLVAGMTATAGSAVSLASSAESVRRSEDVQQLRRRAELSPFDLMLHNVSTALRCLDQDEAFVPCDAEGNEIEVPVFEADEPEGVRRPANPSTFIICWLDYQEKFGLGYALSDGTVGALFRDSSTMVYNYARSHVDYIYAAKTRSGRAELKKDSRPIMSADEIVQPGGDREAKQRFKIMAHFESHITERLMGADHPLLRPDRETTSGMTFVHKWNRFSHAIVFRLSNGVYQLNFFDHLKLFISHNGLVISAIEPAPADHDGDHVPILRSYTLADLVAIAHSSRATREAQAAQDAASQGVACPLARTRPGERRFARTLVRKLRYAHEILMQPNALGSGRRLASQAQLAQE
jgi:polo-like kinase 1